MNRTITTTLAAVATGLLALAMPAAAANRSHDSSAGGSCHSASPTPKFSRNNHYTTNIAATDQYLVCQFQMDDDPTVPATDIKYLELSVVAGASGGTVTCVAQIGALYAGSMHLESSISRSVTLTAGNGGYLNFGANPLIRSVYYNVLTMNCRVPTGFKVGLLEWEDG